jgi:chemotaxis protein CheX
MAYELADPFQLAVSELLQSFLGCEVEHGDWSQRPSMFTSREISVLLGVSGQVRGQVIYGMSRAVALQVATTMIGMPQENVDEMVVSAIGELANMISANAIMRLAQCGYDCDLTPPSVILGSNVEIATLKPALLSVVTFGAHSLEINVAMAGSKSQA